MLFCKKCFLNQQGNFRNADCEFASAGEFINAVVVSIHNVSQRKASKMITHRKIPKSPVAWYLSDQVPGIYIEPVAELLKRLKGVNEICFIELPLLWIGDMNVVHERKV